MSRKNLRAGGVAVGDLGLFVAESVGGAGAVVVASEDVVGLFAEAVPVLGVAGVELRLGLER